MITAVSTLSLSAARKILGFKWPVDHPFSRARRAWIGFDTDKSDASPLRHVFDGQSIVIRCQDWDIDGRDAEKHAAGVVCEGAPTMENAEQLVRFVRGLHDDPVSRSLAVHCHGGLWRSGAVAEFVRVDLGVPELEDSNRLLAIPIGGDREDRTFNAALLRMMREADQALRSQGKVTTPAPSAG